jgi:hypothetical protein
MVQWNNACSYIRNYCYFSTTNLQIDNNIKEKVEHCALGQTLTGATLFPFCKFQFHYQIWRISAVEQKFHLFFYFSN